MIRGFARKWSLLGRRRASALLLAICLNLALVPCTMALEVVEQGHDCCPPEIQLEAAECCELDEVNVDARSGAVKPYDTPDVEAAPPPMSCRANPAHARYIASVAPPDPPGNFPPIHKLNCVYLN